MRRDSILGIVLSLISSTVMAEFRGMPKSIRVIDMKLQTAAAEQQLEICYEAETAIPYFDYVSILSEESHGLFTEENLSYLEFSGPEAIDAKPDGVLLEFQFSGIFKIYAYLDSALKEFHPTQMQFINQIIRYDTNGMNKPIAKTFEGIRDPYVTAYEFERLRICESIPFPLAYDFNFINAMIRRSGLLGFYRFSQSYDLIAFLPMILGGDKIVAQLQEAEIIVPVFYGPRMNQRDFALAEFYHYANSINILKRNFDIDVLRSLLLEFDGVKAEIEDTFGISIPADLTSEDLVRLIYQIGSSSIDHTIYPN